MEEQTEPAIVGIGASAGGVQALQAFFEALPGETGAAFVVVVHLDPSSRSELASILAARTTMPVTQIEETAQLEPNHVYVIAPNRRLRLSDHMISALPFEGARWQRAPIDLFFRSLAQQHGDAFAIILTGAGGDGSIGVKAIKEAGGIVLVQDPSEAEYPSMPRSAIATEVADFVLPVRELADRLVDLLNGREQIAPARIGDGDEDMLRRILAHVRVRTSHDFSQYKRATVLRRIARRAQVTRKDSLSDYYAFLRDNAEEAQALFGDLLISVTTFFRDPKAFDSLARNVIPQLFDGRAPGDAVRLWVPGCATGEEAYSIAMLLLEEAGRRDLMPELQIFATDLDAGALTVAREGRYLTTIEADLTEERLRRFFNREGDHYRVRRELRDIVLFSSHSLLRDPPFSHLDMVSCRNLLIYMHRELQQQVCGTFHYALKPGGFLFLGPSESADQPLGAFRILDREARIFQSVSTADKRPALPVLVGARHPTAEERSTAPALAPPTNYADAALHRQMLERIAPPSMLVDETHRAVHLSESVGRYLQPSGGPVTMDAADLVRKELRFDLRAALHRAFSRGEPTLSMPLLVQFNGSPHRVYVQVRPVLKDGAPERHALVLFIEGEAVPEGWESPGLAGEVSEPSNLTIRHLQEELQLSQNRLLTTREESEGVNEELRAANEELQSINEEYRSTAEELETSKEELQSINEELQTVNNELKLKLESVSRAHSDLQNLLAATDLGTLFLDLSLRIKRFTPPITRIFNITPADEGRPITDFTHQLDYDALIDHARAVLKDLVPTEHEVPSRDGGWYLVRMSPYRTVDDKIDGVVATFIDITERRRALEALRHSEEQLRQQMRLVERSRSPILVWDFDDGIVQWNCGCEELYGYSAEEALGREKEALLRTVVPGGSFDALKQSLLEAGNWSGELLHTTKDGHVLTVESQIELFPSAGQRLVLESTRDISEHKRWEERRVLLLGELTHRIRNTLAVVQSLARQTLRTTRTRADFVERFQGRLLALASAHQLLFAANWEGADLEELARVQLEAYMGGDRHRVHISGPQVTLPAGLGTPFALVLHELATNAAKHGALSVAGGSASLAWEISQGNESRRLKVVWKEKDGPLVAPPRRRGLGTTLIENAIPGAAVRRDFAPEGLVCTIEFDLDTLEHGDQG
jgi:two-component system CheB/CheR fusion protein